MIFFFSQFSESKKVSSIIFPVFTSNPLILQTYLQRGPSFKSLFHRNINVYNLFNSKRKTEEKERKRKKVRVGTHVAGTK